MTADEQTLRVARLPCWSGPVAPEPLGGGMTNRNFTVRDRGRKFVVRLGGDVPVHGLMRFGVLAAARAAHAAGLSPEIVYDEPDVMVMDYVEGKTLTAADMRAPAMLARIVPVVRRCHREMPKFVRGAVLAFWVFHVIRDYAATLRAGNSRRTGDLGRWLAAAEQLEAEIGPVDLVFGHNDLLPANFIDAGRRIWLIDWDYGGFGSPLFDLSGLAANAEFSPAEETALLEAYFERPAGDDLRRRYEAMKCAALLREGMWSLTAEIHSDIEHDFVRYSEVNLARYERAWADFQQHWDSK
ncbi:MAG: phosphotransferase family protein [Rhodospirillales bacterium]|nr:phosphotransferase family protein [Rhodospirillales bacterium]